MSNPFQNCTEVTPQCPLEATTYGYIPNLPSNIVLAVIFGICVLAQIGLAIRYRVWAFGFVVTAGCIMEFLGYVGRSMMHENVWDRAAFRLQVVTLILAPSFLAAGIYLTLKHLVLYYGPEYSRLKPVLYVWIFVGADVASILLQASGGGVASSSDEIDTVDVGNDIMVAGLITQVIVMAFALALALDFTFNLRRGKKVSNHGMARSEGVTGSTIYISFTGLAFLTIFIRSIYRVPELIGGWGNGLMQKELDFMLLDGMMVAIAAVAMTSGHPGIFFPAMSSRNRKSKDEDKEMEMGQNACTP